MSPSTKFSLKIKVSIEEQACDLVARQSGLSKKRVKDCMHKGGVWIKGAGRKATRLRRATTMALAGQTIEIFYDERLLGLIPEQPVLVAQNMWYSIWSKPTGILSQGTRYADHCALPRLTQGVLKKKKELHPVHRLDREARGIVLMAHTGFAAGQLGRLFTEQKISREYQVIIRGIPPWEKCLVEQPLDGKAALSLFQVLHKDENAGITFLDVCIKSGRTHQIRRHLAGLGYPVLGDYRYGQEPKAGKTLQLLAKSLSFVCPWTKMHKQWVLPDLLFPVHAEQKENLFKF